MPATGVKGVRALALGVLKRKTLDSQSCFLQHGTEIQPGSESTAGNPLALPLHIVMQPEAGLTGSFQGSLFQLPEKQRGMEVDNGTRQPTQPLTLECDRQCFCSLFVGRTYFAMAVKAKSTLRPVFALVSMKGSPYSCK